MKFNKLNLALSLFLIIQVDCSKISFPKFEEFDIMSIDDYYKTPHTFPYSFKIESPNKKQLLFYGEMHSNDPKNKQYQEIENAFNDFKPDLVVIEGINKLSKNSPKNIKDTSILKIKSESFETLINKCGAPCYVCKIAADNNIPVICPEPPEKDKIDWLIKKGFTQDQIFALWSFEVVNQYLRLQQKPPFDDYISPFLSHFKNQWAWQDYDFSINQMKRVGNLFYGIELNLQDTLFYDRRTSPNSDGTIINKLSAKDTYFRDNYIVNEIKGYLHDYNRIFIVYGASHAIMQEKALRKLMQNN